jgi:hypothetical protein
VSVHHNTAASVLVCNPSDDYKFSLPCSLALTDVWRPGGRRVDWILSSRFTTSVLVSILHSLSKESNISPIACVSNDCTDDQLC